MDRSRYSRVLVSGGLGFIGSTVTERLLDLGTRVTVVDSCVSNVVTADELDRGCGLMQFIHADISEYLRGPGRFEQFDLVFHAASYVGSVGVLAHVGHLAAHMVAGTAAVLGYCIRTQAHLIFVSSSEVYGKSGVLSEQTDIRVPAYFNPRIEYALAKLTGEAMIHNAAHLGLNAVCLRPFNVVGPRQSGAAGFVLPTFVKQALLGEPLTVFHPGDQARAFISVDDVADLVIRFVTDVGIATPQTVNVGCLRNAVSILELARRVNQAAGRSSSIDIVDPRTLFGELYSESESKQKLCDTQQIERIGWRPRRDLDSIIQDCVHYYRSHVGRPTAKCA